MYSHRVLRAVVVSRPSRTSSLALIVGRSHYAGSLPLAHTCIGHVLKQEIDTHQIVNFIFYVNFRTGFSRGIQIGNGRRKEEIYGSSPFSWTKTSVNSKTWRRRFRFHGRYKGYERRRRAMKYSSLYFYDQD